MNDKNSISRKKSHNKIPTGIYLFRALKEQKNLIKLVVRFLSLHTLFEGSRSSTSKFDVSLGLLTTGIYGAVARKKNNTSFEFERNKKSNLVEDLSNQLKQKMDDL
jgi:hypothetical protein